MLILFVSFLSLTSPTVHADHFSTHLDKAVLNLEHFCADIADREVISFYEKDRCKRVTDELSAATEELRKEILQIKKDIAVLKK